MLKVPEDMVKAERRLKREYNATNKKRKVTALGEAKLKNETETSAVATSSKKRMQPDNPEQPTKKIKNEKLEEKTVDKSSAAEKHKPSKTETSKPAKAKSQASSTRLTATPSLKAEPKPQASRPKQTARRGNGRPAGSFARSLKPESHSSSSSPGIEDLSDSEPTIPRGFARRGRPSAGPGSRPRQTAVGPTSLYRLDCSSISRDFDSECTI